VCSNQSHKLTENTARDFAAGEKKCLGKWLRLPRVCATLNWLHVAAA
jgi:hypothetical protein